MSIASLVHNFAKLGSPTTYNEVDMFSSLPLAADNAGALYYVNTQTGVIFINRKLRGWYRSDGNVWLYGGDLDISADEVSYDNAVSGLTATNVKDAIDELDAGGGGSGPTFVDLETPGGTIDGVNDIFTLANVPNPLGSLQLYRNGNLQSPVDDFNLSGITITFVNGAIPSLISILRASYRY